MESSEEAAQRKTYSDAIIYRGILFCCLSSTDTVMHLLMVTFTLVLLDVKSIQASKSLYNNSRITEQNNLKGSIYKVYTV